MNRPVTAVGGVAAPGSLIHSVGRASTLYEGGLAWRNLISRPVQSLVTVVVVGAALGLTVAVFVLSAGLRQGIVLASDPFGVLVIGPKGSAQQLVLSTILLQGAPIGNMDSHIWEELHDDSRVALAVPLALGDNVGGARILGTTPDFFDLRPRLNGPPTFQLAAGHIFAEPFEAVLGQGAAEKLGLSIGDSFLPQHGVETGLASDTHATPHTVVGILRPVDGPYNNAVFTGLESVHAVHHEGEDDHSEDGEAGAGETEEEAEITALFVRPTGFVEANQLWQEMYTGAEFQAVFPGKELGALFDLLAQGEQLLITAGYLTGAIALLTLFLTIYTGVLAQEQTLAVWGPAVPGSFVWSCGKPCSWPCAARCWLVGWGMAQPG